MDWLEQGKSLNQIVNGTNRTISTWPSSCVDGGALTGTPYNVRNYDKVRGYFGTPKRFTAQSLNSGFTGMASQLDLCDIGNVAKRLGVTDPNGSVLPLATKAPNPSEIIGVDKVSPMAMAGAYAAIANKGVFCQPRVIDKIVDSTGKELELPKRTCTRVLDEKVAATAAYALQGVMTGNGSGAFGNPNDGTQLIGKTGTHETYQTWLITANTKVATANLVGTVDTETPSGDDPDLFHHYYDGWQLSSIRYRLARSIQGAIDGIYPGGKFPDPDSNLTRQVLVTLPSVVGMSVDDATKKLESAGFSVTVGDEVDSDQPKGQIAEQSPGAGKVAGGTNVTISPSNGKGIAVPDVTGRSPEEAVAMIRGAGFGNVDTQCQKDDAGDGTVTGTDPAADTVTGPNTKVTVTYKAPDCGGGKPDKPGKGEGRG
ncbi:PASTA domain-containing protein [Microbacterium elymi]|uniref:PASTA domain-containing protein n=1 Tax=Microbacterium elymi TaxID=2909587 RepID=A0ABY5NIG9_9MICO|nr:PASTA domain-containing protein [Microbacterium elymi]UUT34978.1 PASTA domain-containing protein [Microbacterium elymi]